ncbi:MAG: quinolinate synthase NadA [Bacteroidales bacterium]|nr:quinolinate synthase NadA [Bacteroidales bacterium]
MILSHVYQRAEVQDIDDFVGDSLDLSKREVSTKADVIVFCGHEQNYPGKITTCA